MLVSVKQLLIFLRDILLSWESAFHVVIYERGVTFPGFQKNIIQLLRKRNTLFKKAKRSLKDAHFQQYKKLRNKIVSLMRIKKREYFDKLVMANSKDFWKTVKLLNKNRETIPALQHENHTVTEDTDKASLLNTFFASCWNTVEQPLTEESYHCADLPNHVVTPEEVFALMNKLDVNKANGPDGISAFMLKATARSIASPLAQLFNISLASGKFPEMWKIASIVPIPKSGDKSDPSNYRPISLLSIVSKLLEKIVYAILWDHLLKHTPISDRQWGFQRGKSTTTALLSATHNWFSLLDRQCDVLCVFFDFRKAFDSVPHKQLLEKLSRIVSHQTFSHGYVAISVTENSMF